METEFKRERTLVIIKPDGVQRTLVGEIINRYERIGLKLVAIKTVVSSKEHIEKHYTLDPNWRRVTGEKTIASYEKKGLKPPLDDPLEITAVILENLKKYMTSGPIIAMIWEGAHAIQIVRIDLNICSPYFWPAITHSFSPILRMVPICRAVFIKASRLSSLKVCSSTS